MAWISSVCLTQVPVQVLHVDQVHSSMYYNQPSSVSVLVLLIVFFVMHPLSFLQSFRACMYIARLLPASLSISVSDQVFRDPTVSLVSLTQALICVFQFLFKSSCHAIVPC